MLIPFAKLVSVSDKDPHQVLRKPQFQPFPLPPIIPAFPQSFDWELILRLQKVVHRKPVPFLLHPEREDRADYLGVYCVETLDCGHQVHTFPQSDALTASRRDCKDCGSNLIEFPTQKRRERKAA